MPARFYLLFFAMLLLTMLSGCRQSGPEIELVSGRVTLNGRPLESADLVFQPDGAQRPSIGRTDADGRYDLGYSRGVQGAIVGWHTVRIVEVTAITGGPQRVPPRYNTESELRVQIELGKRNVLDFDLTSTPK